MTSQAERAAAFRALHERPRIFAIPNPWDAGSAKMLAALGFEALATTSAGLAFALGRPDGAACRHSTRVCPMRAHSASVCPEPPISFGTSFIFGRPSRIGSTVS